MNPALMFPMIEVTEGLAVCGLVATCKHLARQSKKLLGNGPLESAQVDQWINWALTNLVPTSEQVMRGVFGHKETPVYQSAWNEAAKELKTQVKLINNQLSGKWLVGNQMTLADIFVALALALPFQTVLDGGFRKAMGKTATWVESVYSLNEVKAVQGKV